MMKKVIGITGGIASGKSNVCNVIKNEGYQIIDSDKINRDLSLKDEPIYLKIVEKFGTEYLTSDGEIDKKKLAKLIFHDSKAKEELNNISHPIIINEIKRQIDLATDDIIFVEIPLLYEAHLEYLCDKVICVFLNKKTQVERLMQREGIDEDYALEKIHSQSVATGGGGAGTIMVVYKATKGKKWTITSNYAGLIVSQVLIW